MGTLKMREWKNAELENNTEPKLQAVENARVQMRDQTGVENVRLELTLEQTLRRLVVITGPPTHTNMM